MFCHHFFPVGNSWGFSGFAVWQAHPRPTPVVPDILIEKPQELPTGKKWWQNMPYYQAVNKTDVKKCRFDKIIVMETFQEILFWIPFCDKAGATDRPHSLFKIVPREILAGLLVIWAKLGNPRQVGVANQAKMMRRLVAGGRFLCNFRIYRLIWEPGSVLRRCHQDIDAVAADIYNDV